MTNEEHWRREDTRQQKGQKSIKKTIKRAKESWIDVQRHDTEHNIRTNNSKKAYQLVKTLTSTKQGQTNTIQCTVQPHSRRWSRGADCLTSTQHRQLPNLAEDVEAAVKSLKKGKSLWIGNIVGKPVQAEGDAVITVIKSAISFSRQESDPYHGLSSYHQPSQERQPLTVRQIPHNQPPKKRHVEGVVKQAEASGKVNHRRRIGRLQTRTQTVW